MGQVVEVVNVNIAPNRFHDHSFTAEIMVPSLPNRYKAPSIPSYDGNEDPDDHLELYMRHMLLHGYSEKDVKCQVSPYKRI